MISQWSVLNAPIITVCHKFYISQHWLQLLHTVRQTSELAHSPKERCAVNNLRNSLHTQLHRKAHTLIAMHWTGHQAAHSEPWVTALQPGPAASPASRIPAPSCTSHPNPASDAPRLCHQTGGLSPSLDSWSELSENNVNNKLLYQHSWGVMNCKKEVGFGRGEIHLWPALLWKSASLRLLLSVTAGVWEKWHWQDIKKLLRGDI